MSISGTEAGPTPTQPDQEGRRTPYGSTHILTVPTAILMEYVVTRPTPALLEALCAFTPCPTRAPCAIPCVLLATLPVALAGSAHNLTAVAAFTHDN